MPAPILKFKRGNLADLPGLQAGEPGFTVDKFDLFIGFNSTTGGNKVVGSSRYWTRETTTAGSGVNLVEGTNNGAHHITLKAPDSIGSNQEYTFPASPTSGGFLRSDGSGTLTWDTGSGFNAGSFPLTALDIDGGTATSTLANADLFIVDDGANGTNRKVTFQTISEAVLGGSGGANFSAINVSGIGTIGSNLIVGGTITAPNIRKSDGGLISLVGVSSASAHTGLVTAFKFRGSGLEDYIVADGVADIVLTGVAATTTTTSQTFTATQGQTTFTFSAGYSDGFLDVYLNGVRLITGTDYAATNGSTFVLTNGATAGDEIEAVAFKGLGQVVTLQSLKIVDNLTVTGVATIGSIPEINGVQLKATGVSTFTGQTNHSTINASSTITGSAFHTGAEGSAIRVTSNTISGPATITLDPAAVGDNTGKVVIAGDLQIDGTTTTVNSTTMTVDDKNIVLGSGAANDAAADGGGITIESGSGNKTFVFQDTGDNLGSSENLNVASGKAYKVNNVSVLNATTLGSSVVASSLTSVGTITSGVWQGTAIANSSLANSSTSVGGVTLTLGGTDATPAFDLTDATNYPTSSLSGTITNAQLAGSIADSKLSTISTANKVSISALDIDGGTGTSTLANADLFIVDDGAGGTNRKVTFQTISNAVLGGSGGATFAAVNVTGITTVGGAFDGNGGANISGGETVLSSATVSDLTDNRVVLAGSSGALEDSGNLTFDGSALTVTGTAEVTSNLVVGGNLTVNGTTSQINTVNTTIEDTLIDLQKVDGGALSSDTNKDVGIVMNYYSGSAKKAAFYWDDSAAKFVVSAVATESSGVLTNSTAGTLELGALFVNDCAGNSQVISCSGTTRSLENITVDGGSF